MEAVYTLLDIERGVPEPWGSQYDIRALAQLGDRDAGWREAKAAPRARGRWNQFRDVWVSESRSDPVEHRNRRAVAGLRVPRRTRRQRAHGRDTQEPSAGDSHGALETSGETEWTGDLVCKVGLVRLLAEGWGRVYART